MRERVGALGIFFASIVSACSSDPGTRVVVIATADPAVVQRADSLRVRVLSGAAGGEPFEEIKDVDALSWPVETTVVPRGGDARRSFVIEIATLDADGEATAVVRASTGFVAGETRALRMHLDRACLGVLSCDELETCADGACVDARVDPRTLPPFGSDAQVPDPGIDGGTPGLGDAGIDACTPMTSYADEDGDGWGDSATLTSSCSVAPGRVTRGEDCDDACPTCTPAGVERCDGAYDEDCDGTTDEGCACTTGSMRACPAGTDAGECVAGSQTCTDGTWGPCTDRVDPVPEDCDGADDDCDARIDEGLRRACGSDVGACARGYETCAAGAWGACTATAPTTEVCNGADDDCDGRTDEMVGSAFFRDADGDGFGNPSVTTVGCAAAAGWVAMAGDCNDACRTCRPGGAEVCDGMLDENCSMGVDEGCSCTTGATRACPEGVDTGECAAGTQTCSAGRWGACTGRVAPATETCNGRDDDCDARVDEALVQACGPSGEVGICRRGTQSCSAGAWSTCAGAVMATTELCNGLDDDCDGTVDDGVLVTFYADGDGDGYGTMASMVQACTMPTGYAARAGDCDDARDTVRPGAPETCNMRDDDCDTRVDEGVTCGTDAGTPAMDAGVPMPDGGAG